MVPHISDEKYWKVRVWMCWIKWALIVVFVTALAAGFLFVSIVITLNGHKPIEGDTYSTPGGNVVFLLVIIALVLFARSSNKKRRSQQKSHVDGTSKNIDLTSDSNN